jgi:hypothetical protein
MPEELQSFAVSGDRGLGPHHDQSVTPVEPTAQHRRQAARIVGPSGLDRAFLVKGELLTQEQILGRQRGLWSRTECQEPEAVAEDLQLAQAAVGDAHGLLPSIESYALRLQEFCRFQVQAVILGEDRNDFSNLQNLANTLEV